MGQLIFTLDFSRLKVADHIQIGGMRLTRIALPSNVALTMTRMGFDTNAQLSKIAGFENVKLTRAEHQRRRRSAHREQRRASHLSGRATARLVHRRWFRPRRIIVSGKGPCAP